MRAHASAAGCDFEQGAISQPSRSSSRREAAVSCPPRGGRRATIGVGVSQPISGKRTGMRVLRTAAALVPLACLLGFAIFVIVATVRGGGEPTTNAVVADWVMRGLLIGVAGELGGSTALHQARKRQRDCNATSGSGGSLPFVSTRRLRCPSTGGGIYVERVGRSRASPASTPSGSPSAVGDFVGRPTRSGSAPAGVTVLDAPEGFGSRVLLLCKSSRARADRSTTGFGAEE